jgi:hypothetical protein
MKLSNVHRQRGSILIVALVIGLVIGLSLVSYLSWASTQNRLIMRSQSWNGALTLVEAGLEEAMAHLKESPTNRARYGWTLSGNNVGRKRVLGEGYYQVLLQTNNPPNIISEGFFRAPLARDQYISRKVMVTTTNDPVFNFALLADETIDLNGNRLRVDSFNSIDPNLSTGGQYDPNKYSDNGNVAVNMGNLNGLRIGNAKIYGNIATGAGGTAQVLNGAVGSLAWHQSGANGAEPGSFSDDFHQPLDIIESPSPTGSVPVTGDVGGITYDYILTDGTWQVSEVSGSVLVTGDATLIVDGDVDITGTDSIVIEPGGSLEMHVNGSGVKLGSAGLINKTYDASKFSLFGGENLTELQLIGSVEFIGVIYAPEADISIGGGGSSTLNMVGAVVGNSIRLTGHVNAHYDEALMDFMNRGYVITSWNEI